MEQIKIIKKINILMLMLIIISVMFSNYSYAVGNIFSDADGFLSKGNSVSSTIDETQLIETSDFLYKLLLAIGIVVMFIVGTIIGIQFMVASAEDKAKVKEALIPYIVGCVVIFGAFTIWRIAVNLGQSITSSSGTISDGGSGPGGGGNGGEPPTGKPNPDPSYETIN